MKYIIHSLDARNQAKPFYRETKVWRIEDDAVNIFYVSDRNKATRFEDVDKARRWAREILFLDIFSIEPV